MNVFMMKVAVTEGPWDADSVKAYLGGADVLNYRQHTMINRFETM